MIVAKNTLFPKTKTEGNSRYRFVVFTSDHGHYSVKKAAILLGLGSDAVWRVKVDRQGRMLTDGKSEQSEDCWRGVEFLFLFFAGELILKNDRSRK
jgi:glutamate/tyrosine decarboxylase-like PLP-dependent enzyme